MRIFCVSGRGIFLAVKGDFFFMPKYFARKGAVMGDCQQKAAALADFFGYGNRKSQDSPNRKQNNGKNQQCGKTKGKKFFHKPFLLTTQIPYRKISVFATKRHKKFPYGDKLTKGMTFGNSCGQTGGICGKAKISGNKGRWFSASGKEQCRNACFGQIFLSAENACLHLSLNCKGSKNQSSGQHFFCFFQNFFIADFFQTVFFLPAGGFAVEGTGAAGHIFLQDAGISAHGKKSPFL